MIFNQVIDAVAHDSRARLTNQAKGRFPGGPVNLDRTAVPLAPFPGIFAGGRCEDDIPDAGGPDDQHARRVQFLGFGYQCFFKKAGRLIKFLVLIKINLKLTDNW